MRAENVGLEIDKAGKFVRHEAFHVQDGVRVRLLRDLLRIRKPDLPEVLVGLAPESAAPGLVEGLDAAVFLFEPSPEGSLGIFAVVHHSVMAGLIVNLPADDIRIVAVSFCQFGDNALYVFPVAFAAPGCVLAAAVLNLHSVVTDNENVRVFLRQPDRRGRRRGAENDLETMLLCQRNRLVEPGEVEFSFFRLHHPPGELGEMGEFYTHCSHIAQIPVPLGLVPLLRIVI